MKKGNGVMVNISARSVLLLNVGYQPIKTITIRHAVELLLRDAAIAVDGIAARLRTPSTVFEVPSVLRLKYYVNAPRNDTWSRRSVLVRDHYTCIYCGKHQASGLSKSDFTIDHIIPKAQGGKDTWGNTACACWPCNNRKGSKTPHQAGMKMRWEPKRPRGDVLVASGNVPKEWKIYLNIG